MAAEEKAIFLCHTKRSNRWECEQFLLSVIDRELREAGFSTFMDVRDLPGSSINRCIEDARNAKLLLAILDDEFPTPYCRREIDAAHEAGVPVQTIYAQDIFDWEDVGKTAWHRKGIPRSLVDAAFALPAIKYDRSVHLQEASRAYMVRTISKAIEAGSWPVRAEMECWGLPHRLLNSPMVSQEVDVCNLDGNAASVVKHHSGAWQFKMCGEAQPAAELFHPVNGPLFLKPYRNNLKLCLEDVDDAVLLHGSMLVHVANSDSSPLQFKVEGGSISVLWRGEAQRFESDFEIGRGRGRGFPGSLERCQLHHADDSVPRQHVVVRRQGGERRGYEWRLTTHPKKDPDPERLVRTWLSLREGHSYLIPQGVSPDGKVALFVGQARFLIQSSIATLNDLRELPPQSS